MNDGDMPGPTLQEIVDGMTIDVEGLFEVVYEDPDLSDDAKARLTTELEEIAEYLDACKKIIHDDISEP